MLQATSSFVRPQLLCSAIPRCSAVMSSCILPPKPSTCGTMRSVIRACIHIAGIPILPCTGRFVNFAIRQGLPAGLNSTPARRSFPMRCSLTLVVMTQQEKVREGLGVAQSRPSAQAIDFPDNARVPRFTIHAILRTVKFAAGYCS